ncbi:hypothetical protein GCM10009853_054060 [Glycomyces scopariae]
MTDRDPARPEADAPQSEPAPAEGQDAGTQAADDVAADAVPQPEHGRAEPAPEPVERLDPPIEPIPDLTTAPEPEAPSQQAPEPIEAEPHTSVEAVAEPVAPAQIAPESGAAPIPFEPEPSVPERTDGAAPVALAQDFDQTADHGQTPGYIPAAGTDPAADPAADLGTADTLALPPTTAAVEPPAVSSAPPSPTGVPVPFAAPPTERNGGRLALKLSLGIGGGVIVVVSVVLAIILAVTTMTNSIADEVHDTAAGFVAELADGDWDGAYAMLCDDLRDRPAADYIPEWESWEPSSAEVQPLAFDDVDVRVRLGNGSEIALVIQLDQTEDSLGTSVCGWYDVT